MEKCSFLPSSIQSSARLLSGLFGYDYCIYTLCELQFQRQLYQRCKLQTIKTSYNICWKGDAEMLKLNNADAIQMQFLVIYSMQMQTLEAFISFSLSFIIQEDPLKRKKSLSHLKVLASHPHILFPDLPLNDRYIK